MYTYKRSIWGTVYRMKNDGSLPEQYMTKEGVWKFTDDAFAAFYDDTTSDFLLISEAEVKEVIND